MAQKSKMKILKKYMGVGKITSSNKNVEDYGNIQIKDEDDFIPAQLSESISESSQQKPQKRRRIDSSDEQHQETIKRVKNEEKKQKRQRKQMKVRKKLRKALGLQNDEEIDEFMSNLQVEGIQKKQIIAHLKQNKNMLIKKQEDVVKKQKKQKKKQKKSKKEKNNKFEMFQKSSSSDMEIPQQARTIYRNKDGSKREFSKKQEKQKHQKQIYERLAEWEKGMAQQDSENEQNQDLQRAKNNKMWDDPMKRWQGQGIKKVLSCKFEGVANRFNIKPGYRWDGVIRGNGFENKYLQEINLKKAKKAREDVEYLKDL